MDLQQLKKNWDTLGAEDPMWAVLSDPQKRGGKWDATEFFQSGEKHIADVMDELKQWGVPVRLGVALDFGCGVGRLTQALAARFEEVHGVDIAPSMIENANKFNKYGGKCHYHVTSSDLSLFPDGKFDFVYTCIVFQHIPEEFVLQYVREFVRVLRPGGIARFHIVQTSFLRSLAPRWVINFYRSIRYRGQNEVFQFGARASRVDTALRECDAKVLKCVRAPSGSKPGWFDYTYIVSRA